MKKFIILSSIALFAASLFLKNHTLTVDQTNELFLENVQALADSGGGENPPTDPENPNEEISECWELFEDTRVSEFSRMCVTLQQRAQYIDCLEFYSKYKPVDSSKKQCKFKSEHGS